MYKITNKKEFECLITLGEIPEIIANQVYGDLLMFEEYFKEEYSHNDKSMIVIIDKKDFISLDDMAKEAHEKHLTYGQLQRLETLKRRDGI